MVGQDPGLVGRPVDSDQARPGRATRRLAGDADPVLASINIAGLYLQTGFG